MNQNIEAFLASETYAVAGASANPKKFGNRVFHALLKSKRATYPLNPAASQVDGHQAYPSISELPVVPDAISVIITAIDYSSDRCRRDRGRSEACLDAAGSRRRSSESIGSRSRDQCD